MFTVALIGPDGAGKTTICRRLQRSLPLPSTYIYMGVNLQTSNLVLPTTRLILEIKRAMGKRPDMAGPPDPTRRKPPPRGILRRTLAGVKGGLRLANQIAEEWFRQLVVWYHVRRGKVVLLDRHFFVDYYAHDVAPRETHRSLCSRIHGFVLGRFYPRPDLVVFLDAPAELLFARKGEGTVELLERRRQEYLRMRHVVPHFRRVDATRSEEEVTRDVSDLICDFHHKRVGGSPALDNVAAPTGAAS